MLVKASVRKWHAATKKRTPAPAPDTNPEFAGVTTFYKETKK